MGCERCGAAQAEFYATDGAQVCRICYYAEQTEIQDKRAEEAINAELPDGVRVATGNKKKKAKPGRVLQIGLVLTLMGLVLNGGAWFLLGDFDFKMLAFMLFGVGTALEGYRTRAYQ